jgi:anti-sigma factor (TIGR02949 family)
MADERYGCEDVFRRLDDYLDRELSAAERELVAQHLTECEACAREYRFETAFITDVRNRLRRIRAPDDLLDRIAGKLNARPD